MLERDFQGGDVLGADDLNALWALWRALGKISGVAPVQVAQDGAGISVSVSLPNIWWLKLTSGTGSGAYAWTRVIPGTTAGTWVASPGGETGTTMADPAYESNNNGSLSSGTFVPAWREPTSGSLVFMLGTCP